MVITLPETIDVDHFEVDPGEGCGTTGPPRRGRPDRDVGERRRGLDAVATKTFVDADRHRMNVVAPARVRATSASCG